jgi:hypothetical protein
MRLVAVLWNSFFENLAKGTNTGFWHAVEFDLILKDINPEKPNHATSFFSIPPACGSL